MVRMLDEPTAKRWLKNDQKNFSVIKHSFNCYVKPHQFRRGNDVITSQVLKMIGRFNKE